MSVIQIRNLSKSYGTHKALDNVSLSIEEGEKVGLIGANGAGKSTLLNILLRIIPYDSGEIRVLGKPLRKTDYHLREKIGFVSEDVSLIPWASTCEIADLYQHLYPEWNQPYLEKLMAEWKIDPSRRLKTMSKGQKKLCELALCLASRPSLLRLDEPFANLDAVMRIQVVNALLELNARHKTAIFYSSHILSEMERIAKRIIIIKDGAVCCDQRVNPASGSIEDAFAQYYGLQINRA